MHLICVNWVQGQVPSFQIWKLFVLPENMVTKNSAKQHYNDMLP